MLQPRRTGFFRFPWTVQLGFFTLAFGIVSYFAYQVHTSGLHPGLLAFMGIDPAVVESPAVHERSAAPQRPPTTGRSARVIMPNHLVWCPVASVDRLEKPGSYVLVQSEQGWVRTGSPSVPAGRVFEWLSQYCSLRIEPYTGRPTAAGFTPILRVVFQGREKEIARSPSGVYSFEHRLFRSRQLDEAIKNLDVRAGLTP